MTGARKSNTQTAFLEHAGKMARRAEFWGARPQGENLGGVFNALDQSDLNTALRYRDQIKLEHDDAKGRALTGLIAAAKRGLLCSIIALLTSAVLIVIYWLCTTTSMPVAGLYPALAFIALIAILLAPL